MPFTKAQTVIKKILPQIVFDALYNKACNAWDIYQKVNDRTFFIPSYLYYKLSGNKEASRKIEIVQKVLSHTMVSKVGVEATYDIAFKATKELSGSFVECGVARGGCSAVLALIAKDEGNHRKTMMFDSFEGLPPQTDKDGVQKPIRHKNRKANDLAEGYCLGTYEDVVDWFYKLHIKLDAIMVQGLFQGTLPFYKDHLAIKDNIAVLRLDGDWYESTKCCLNELYPNVEKGGYVIIDDYQLLGCKKAVDEFLTTLNPSPKITLDKNGRSYFQK